MPPCSRRSRYDCAKWAEEWAEEWAEKGAIECAVVTVACRAAESGMRAGGASRVSRIRSREGCGSAKRTLLATALASALEQALGGFADLQRMAGRLVVTLQPRG